MKNKALLFGAMMLLTSTPIGVIFDIVNDGIYNVPVNWGTKFVVLIWSVAIVKNSELSKLQKILWAGAALATYAAVVVILATLGWLGLIHTP
jgi:hypothetical protein